MQQPIATLISDPHHLHPGKSDLLIVIRFIKGSGTLTIDSFPYPIRANSLFIIHPHSDYSLNTDSGHSVNSDSGHSVNAAGESDMEGWSLSIREDYLYEAGSNLLALIFGLRNSSRFSVPKNKGEKLDQLFYFLQDQLHAQLPGSDPVINAYLTILLSEFNLLSKGPLAGRSPHDPRYDEFLDLVNKEFREIRDIETYAARIHLSSKQLNRICKEASGRTPGQLLDRRIYLEASRLLHYTNRSVKEISYELGFGEPSYFIKFYRRFNTRTPHQYRQYLSEKRSPHSQKKRTTLLS